MLAGILERNIAHGKFCGEANDTFLYQKIVPHSKECVVILTGIIF